MLDVSLLRAECFSSSLDISIFQFLTKKRKKISAVFFFSSVFGLGLWSGWIRIHLKCWIRIRIRSGSNESGSVSCLDPLNPDLKLWFQGKLLWCSTYSIRKENAQVPNPYIMFCNGSWNQKHKNSDPSIPSPTGRTLWYLPYPSVLIWIMPMGRVGYRKSVEHSFLSCKECIFALLNNIKDKKW